MKILYLSPAFPPGSHRFCLAARARGATVVAIGDVAENALPAGLSAALTEYRFLPDMGSDDALIAAVADLTRLHGPFDRLESNGEHWLETEGRLRDHFGIPGASAAEVRRLRSKLAMAEVFRQADIPYPEGIRCDDAGAVRDLARKHGYPLVFKPDAGSGSVDTFRVGSDVELEAALLRPLSGHLVQPFIEGAIVTFDGLLDGDGTIVFCTSHVYDEGIMQLRSNALDGHYYSVRVIPPALEEIGRRAVKAFGLRERFFHLELFARPDGTYVGLEMNIRPPGGFTLDMMGYAADIDVYDLWAAVLMNEVPPDFHYQPRYFTAHAGRRAERDYFWSEADLVRDLGATLVAVLPIPQAFAATMGNVAYLVRHEQLNVVAAALAKVHRRT